MNNPSAPNAAQVEWPGILPQGVTPGHRLPWPNTDFREPCRTARRCPEKAKESTWARQDPPLISPHQGKGGSPWSEDADFSFVGALYPDHQGSRRGRRGSARIPAEPWGAPTWPLLPAPTQAGCQ